MKRATWAACVAAVLAVVAFAAPAFAASPSYWSSEARCSMPHSIDPFVSTRWTKVGNQSWVDRVKVADKSIGRGPVIRSMYADIYDDTTGGYLGSARLTPGARSGTWTVPQGSQLSGAPRGHKVRVVWTVAKKSWLHPDDTCTVTNTQTAR